MPDTREKVEWFSLSDHFPVAHPRFTWYNVIQQEKHKVYRKW